MEDIKSLKIGEETAPLPPKNVVVGGMRVEDVNGSDGKKVGTKLYLTCKHPDQDVPIEISKVKYNKDDKLAVSGTWMNLDKEGKIPFNSAVAHMMRFYMVASMGQLEGKELQTVADDKGFLMVKAY